MRRIILMVLYNLPFVPYWWWQLCHFAKHTEEIPEPEKYALLKKITLHANKGGRVKIDVHGREHIPTGESFVFSPTTRDSSMCWRLLRPEISPFRWWQKKK